MGNICNTSKHGEMTLGGTSMISRLSPDENNPVLHMKLRLVPPYYHLLRAGYSHLRIAYKG